MDDLITARYTLTAGDFAEFCVAHQRYLWKCSPILRSARIFVGVLIAVGFGAVLVGGIQHAADPATLFASLALLFITIAALGFLFHPRSVLNRLWYRAYFRMAVPEGSRSIEWGFDGERLWSRTPLAEGTYRWELFARIVETPNCILFFQTKWALSLYLPSRGFSSPGMLRTFTDLARTKVPNYVVLGECRFPAKPEPIGLDEL